MDIRIRALTTMPELDQVVDLQRSYWGERADDLVPAHMLFSLAHYGGHVLGAFDGDKLIGASIGFLGTNADDADTRPAMANLLIMSKRLIVHPEYRGFGVGFQLKLAQRRLAMRQGVRLVTWTFDPMYAPNAHLNFHKLGGVSDRYIPNYYGEQESESRLKADRLVVDWWVTHRRVEERIRGQRADLTLKLYLDSHAQLVNPAVWDAEGLPHPPETGTLPQGAFALVELPMNFGEIERKDEALAAQWRAHIREVLGHLLSVKFVVTDFVIADYEGRRRGFYVLSFDIGFDFRMN